MERIEGECSVVVPESSNSVLAPDDSGVSALTVAFADACTVSLLEVGTVAPTISLPDTSTLAPAVSPPNAITMSVCLLCRKSLPQCTNNKKLLLSDLQSKVNEYEGVVPLAVGIIEREFRDLVQCDNALHTRRRIEALNHFLDKHMSSIIARFSIEDYDKVAIWKVITPVLLQLTRLFDQLDEDDDSRCDILLLFVQVADLNLIVSNCTLMKCISEKAALAAVSRHPPLAKHAIYCLETVLWRLYDYRVMSLSMSLVSEYDYSLITISILPQVISHLSSNDPELVYITLGFLSFVLNFFLTLHSKMYSWMIENAVRNHMPFLWLHSSLSVQLSLCRYIISVYKNIMPQMDFEEKFLPVLLNGLNHCMRDSWHILGSLLWHPFHYIIRPLLLNKEVLKHIAMVVMPENMFTRVITVILSFIDYLKTDQQCEPVIFDKYANRSRIDIFTRDERHSICTYLKQNEFANNLQVAASLDLYDKGHLLPIRSTFLRILAELNISCSS